MNVRSTIRNSSPTRRRTASRLLGMLLLLTLLPACRAVEELQNVQPVGITTGTVHGRVLDQQTGAPIATGNVLLLDASGEPVQNQTSSVHIDAEGAFRFPNVQPGTYRLRVAVPGYEPRLTDPFLVERGDSFRADLRVARRAGP